MDTNNLSTLLSGVMSNPEMMGKLQGILSDPNAMDSIRNAVSGVSHESSEIKESTAQASVPAAAPQNDDAKNRARLISALKPYLSEERRDKADKLLSLLTLLSVSGNFKL